MQTLILKEVKVKMINYDQYIDTSIKEFVMKTGVQRNDTFSTEELKKLLKEDVESILGKFESKIKKISKEILMPLDVSLKVNNITVGQEISRNIIPVDFKLLENEYFNFRKIEGIEEIEGISWDSKEQMIKGKAIDSGDYVLIAHGVFKSSKEYQQKIESHFRLTVIADPRSLWKNLEPNENLDYPKSHEYSNHLKTKENYRLFFASKRGRSHAHIGTFRDDDGKIITSPSGWSVLCVADGAGSCSLSREGSKIASNTASNMLIELLSSQNADELEALFLNNLENPSKELEEEIEKKLEETIVTGAYHALRDIHEKAQSINEHPKEFSTTLLLTAHKKVVQGHIIISFWIGDGVIAIYKRGQKVEILGEPDSGEFAGQTRFLSHNIFDKENIKKRTSIKLVKDFTALILATDGVSDPFFNTDEELQKIKIWDKFWIPLSFIENSDNMEDSTEKLLKWLDFWSIGNHDDRSIALLLPPNILQLTEQLHV